MNGGAVEIVDMEFVPCRICERPTPFLGTRLCPYCHEVECRIDDFAKTPQGRERLLRALDGPLTDSEIDALRSDHAVFNASSAVLELLRTINTEQPDELEPMLVDVVLRIAATRYRRLWKSRERERSAAS